MMFNVDKELIKIKRKVNKLINEKKYNLALQTIGFAANVMYEYNQKYSDIELEKYLGDICEKVIVNNNITKIGNHKIVLFYDGFGFDFRGLAFIYLSALAELGFKIYYLVNKDRMDEIPNIKELIDCHQGRICTLIKNETIDRIQQIIDISLGSNAGVFFFYSHPSDASGAAAFNCLNNCGTRFQINLTDHAFWLGINAFDYCIEFRKYGALISNEYRGIKKEKLIILPYHPVMKDSGKFCGFPFHKQEDDVVVFSGGALYKTIGENDAYYKIVRKMLEKNKNVKFWYAGFGNHEKIDKLAIEYPGRVFFTSERKDLMQIMKHIDVYINTYPIVGGLMTQYAAIAGVIPLTLDRKEYNRGLLQWDTEKYAYFHKAEDLLEEFDKLCRNKIYRKEIGNKISRGGGNDRT